MRDVPIQHLARRISLQVWSAIVAAFDGHADVGPCLLEHIKAYQVLLPASFKNAVCFLKSTILLNSAAGTMPKPLQLSSVKGEAQCSGVGRRASSCPHRCMPAQSSATILPQRHCQTDSRSAGPVSSTVCLVSRSHLSFQGSYAGVCRLSLHRHTYELQTLHLRINCPAGHDLAIQRRQ